MKRDDQFATQWPAEDGHDVNTAIRSGLLGQRERLYPGGLRAEVGKATQAVARVHEAVAGRLAAGQGRTREGRRP